MKKTFLLLCMLLTIAVTSAKDIKTVVNPSIMISNAGTSLQFSKVIISDTATVIECHSKFRPKNWIRISKDSFLEVDGKKYSIKRGIGINIGELFWLPESGEADFAVVFEPLPKNTKMFNFKEGENNGDWKIYGVSLTSKIDKIKLPDGFGDNIKSDDKMPAPQFKNGTAKIRGYILGLPRGEKIEGKISYNDLKGRNEVIIHLDDTGYFETSINILSSTLVYLAFENRSAFFIVFPDTESSICMNLPAMANPSKSKQKHYYFDGYMAAFNQDLMNSPLFFNIMKSYSDIENKIRNLDIDASFKYLYEISNKNIEIIDKSKLTDDEKDYCKVRNVYTLVSVLYSIPYIIASNEVKAGNIKESEMRNYIMEIFTKDKQNECNSYMNEIVSDIKNNGMWHLYQNLDYFLGTLKRCDLDNMKWNEKDVKFIDDYLNYLKMYDNLKSFIVLDDAQISGVENIEVRNSLLAENEALKKKIEENKKKTSYRINNIGEVANEDLFASIINKYKGKPILIDLWATWCGPCKMANKMMKPLKEEFKDKLVFIYVAGENSPKATWENMIADIDGEHIRLNKSQWEYICNEFNSNGVPTYLLVDKNGNVTYKEVGYPGNDKMKNRIDKVVNQ